MKCLGRDFDGFLDILGFLGFLRDYRKASERLLAACKGLGDFWEVFKPNGSESWRQPSSPV